MQYLNNYSSPLGSITLASNGTEITGLWFDGQKYFASTLNSQPEKRDLPIFEEAKAWLELYFKGQEPDFKPALHLEGTPFRMAVWHILTQIPYGEVVTYKDIAQQIARKSGKENMSSQAIGGAVSHNPVSILIPCHRVIGTNGSLTGYAGGLSKKIELLTLEQVDTTRLFIPKQGMAL